MSETEIKFLENKFIEQQKAIKHLSIKLNYQKSLIDEQNNKIIELTTQIQQTNESVQFQSKILNKAARQIGGLISYLDIKPFKINRSYYKYIDKIDIFTSFISSYRHYKGCIFIIFELIMISIAHFFKRYNFSTNLDKATILVIVTIGAIIFCIELIQDTIKLSNNKIDYYLKKIIKFLTSNILIVSFYTLSQLYLVYFATYSGLYYLYLCCMKLNIFSNDNNIVIWIHFIIILVTAKIMKIIHNANIQTITAWPLIPRNNVSTHIFNSMLCFVMLAIALYYYVKYQGYTKDYKLFGQVFGQGYPLIIAYIINITYIFYCKYLIYKKFYNKPNIFIKNIN